MFFVGDVWNGFLFGHARGEIVPCRFCGGFDGDWHIFWECPHLPLVQMRENPEFHDLIQRDKRSWPRCLLWHGWLHAPDSSGRWAVGLGRVAADVLWSRLGGYIPHSLEDWAGAGDFVSGTGSGALSVNPDVWTDGSLVRDEVAGTCGGAGVFALVSGASWFHRSWWHLDMLPPDEDSGTERCRLYLSVPKPLQTVQRAELWEVITALQVSGPVHLGVDNANVVGHVARIIANKSLARPFELLVDGDLLALVKMLVEARGDGTTAISKVKGHADEGLVRDGRVREVDKIGNDLADEAANFGRRRVGADVVDARRDYTSACRDWHTLIRDLHRFFIAMARVIVNDDGKVGTDPDPLVWCSGAKGKRRRVIEAILEFAMLPGPRRLWVGGWHRWPDITISVEDVGRWPFSPGALVKLAAFLSSLSWPGEVADLRNFGVSYVELLVLYERCAGERLQVEESTPKYRRPGRPISVSAVPLCPDVDIWKLCQHFGNMMRALQGPAWRFREVHPWSSWGQIMVGCVMLVGIGAVMVSLVDLGTLLLNGFLSDLLGSLGYPKGSGSALLDGTLKLKYHTFLFERRKPNWRLTSPGRS